MDTQHTAITLQRSKQQASQYSSISKSEREKNLDEKKEYYKTRLLEAMHAKKQNEIKEYLQKVLQARAEQMAIKLEDEAGNFNQKKLPDELEAYYKDAYRLLKHFHVFLEP